ncbi:hypothetical protein [Streptomyces sp. yr375]|uniref:hypothetical protein n=1 Tax=Streptomyces sp. yr375 TaxID=1761906 RepID=UPI001160E058|nr:hypothetical protein [Streptomyces sp. yr375]
MSLFRDDDAGPRTRGPGAAGRLVARACGGQGGGGCGVGSCRDIDGGPRSRGPGAAGRFVVRVGAGQGVGGCGMGSQVGAGHASGGVG